jgi:N-methylhydantoinase A
VRAERASLEALNGGLKMLGERGVAWLAGENEPRGTYQWFADLRYSGQNFELMLELKGDRLDERALSRLVESFHSRHMDQYGYDMRAQPVEIVNLRLAVTGRRRSLAPERVPLARGEVKAAVIERRKVWFPERGYVTTAVYDRDRLPAERAIDGPAIIEQMDTTTVVPPGARVKQDRHGYLHMQLEVVQTKRSAAWAAA